MLYQQLPADLTRRSTLAVLPSATRDGFVLWIPLPQLLPSSVLSVCLHHLQRLELFLHRCS